MCGWKLRQVLVDLVFGIQGDVPLKPPVPARYRPGMPVEAVDQEIGSGLPRMDSQGETSYIGRMFGRRFLLNFWGTLLLIGLPIMLGTALFNWIARW